MPKTEKKMTSLTYRGICYLFQGRNINIGRMNIGEKIRIREIRENMSWTR